MTARVLASSLAVAACCVLPLPAQQPASTNAPKLACDEPVHDFGVVDPSQAVEHTFLIRNDGTLTLEITRVHASCGCTVANISEQQIPPGGESRITTRLSLQGKSGTQQKTVFVDSNDPAQPQTILTLRGTATPSLSVSPAQVAASRIAPGSTPAAQVSISSSDDTDFRITAVGTTSDQLAATVDTLESNRNYRVNIALKAPISATVHASVVINTDHPKRARVEIPVSFTIARELVVIPREIIFEQPADTPVSPFVLIRNADGSPVELDGIEPPVPTVRVETHPYGANGLRIQMNDLVPKAELNGRVLRIHPRHSQPVDVPIRILDQG